MEPHLPPSDRPALAGKRILMVLGCLDMGGAERQGVYLARGLTARHGASVMVWSFRPPGRAAELGERLGIASRYLPEPWGPGALRWPGMIWNFTRLLRRERPDILLPFTSFPNIVCGLCWRLAGVRVCVWNQLDAGLNLDSPAARWAAWNTPLFLSNSRIGVDSLMSRFGVRPERIAEVRNALYLDPPAADRPAWRARLGADANALVAVMVANIRPPKDHATLLRAWRTVADRMATQRRHALLALAGSVETGHPLPEIIRDLKLDNHVRVLGHVDDVAGLLGAADLGVYSSLSEGCPNGVIESMAAGLPVAATDLPGIREALGPEGLAWLTPPGDAQALAERICRLADDPALAAELGAHHRRRAQQEFSAEAVTDHIASLLAAAWRDRRFVG